MGLVLDSGIFIMAEKRGWSLKQLTSEIIRRFGSIPICTSVVSIAELAHGTYRSTEPHRERQNRFLQEVLLEIRVELFTVPIALQVAEVGAQLAVAGNGLAFQDLVIGLTAVELSYAVLTNNPRHFHRIPGLQVHSL